MLITKAYVIKDFRPRRDSRTRHKLFGLKLSTGGTLKTFFEQKKMERILESLRSIQKWHYQKTRGMCAEGWKMIRLRSSLIQSMYSNIFF